MKKDKHLILRGPSYSLKRRVPVEYHRVDDREVVWISLDTDSLVQTAEKGSYPEVVCATEDGLEQRALYGPTGLMQTGGPVGKGTLNPHAYDKAVMSKLWDVSEEATDFDWGI